MDNRATGFLYEYPKIWDKNLKTSEEVILHVQIKFSKEKEKNKKSRYYH